MLMTVTLDPDVAERIEQEVRRAGKPAHAVVNDALRGRLGLKGEASAQQPFRVEPHDFRFAAGLDLDKMNRLVDDLEAAGAAQKIGK
ncbi:MAG TPA: antitoxin [Thermoanaerobaculia bacterium]|nr:antitoxin [Thermoanaerobaculia bacterium]